MSVSSDVENLLKAVFSELRDERQPDFEQRCSEFIFHMTDCIDDVRRLNALFEAKSMDVPKAAQQLVGILSHVPAHFNAASRLLLDRVLDPFDHE